VTQNPDDMDPNGNADDGEAEDTSQLTASDEMEEALRAAEEAVSAKPKPGGGESSDKLTIELLSNELQALKAEFEAREAELSAETDRHVRLQAEFENFRRRGLKERQETLQYGHQNLVKDLLTAVDNLERAIEHTEQSPDAELTSLLQGVVLVQRELLGALGKHGVSVVEAEDQLFDPAVHEAMGQVPSADVAPNTVVQVLQKGYQLRDRLLRPARVMVSSADSGPGGEGGSGTG
jgi:molecular chaperone GrpE